MSCSDWVSIVCAAVSLIATIVIAVLQLWQSDRMAKFEHRQDERDERRHAEEVDARAAAFVSQHYADRLLIPLGAIAAMYNAQYHYSRDTYNGFCALTREVQNRVLELCEVDLRVSDESVLFDRCVDAVNNIIRKQLHDETTPLYDSGKYLKRCLDVHGKEVPPYEIMQYADHLTDVLAEAFRGKGPENPVYTLESQYGFSNVEQAVACEFTAILARYVAIYSDDRPTDKIYSWFDDCGNVTMEDLFLQTLLDMYVHLILEEV